MLDNLWEVLYIVWNVGLKGFLWVIFADRLTTVYIICYSFEDCNFSHACCVANANLYYLCPKLYCIYSCMKLYADFLVNFM